LTNAQNRLTDTTEMSYTNPIVHSTRLNSACNISAYLLRKLLNPTLVQL